MMMLDKVKAWIYRHRKGLIVVSIVAITGAVVILLIKGKKVAIPVTEVAEKIVPEAPKAVANAVQTAETVTINVDGVMKTFPRAEFIRHLHEGWSASPAKIAQAIKMGIDLKPGETIVNACTVVMRSV